MAKYLVTGGCGFIGSHLVEELLARRHKVIVIDDLSTGKLSNLPKHVKVIVGDIRDKILIRSVMQGVDGCFHLAAIASVERSTNEWFNTHSINLSGTINVFDAARASNENPIPVVYASSAAVYGDNASIPLSENAKLRPLSAYGADKLGCELHARIAGVVHNLPTMGFRFFNVYGSRQDPNSPYSGVISIFSQRISQGKNINIFGEGNQIRDFVYVKDVIKFLCKGMLDARICAPVYNVCSGKSTSLKQLIKTLFTIAGYIVPISYKRARIGDIQSSIGDPLLSAKILNVRAQVKLGDGLKETYHSLNNALLVDKAS